MLYNKANSVPSEHPQGFCASGQHPITGWARSVRIACYDNLTATFEPSERFWSCDSGLLVYLDPLQHFYVVVGLEPESRILARVPFDCKDRRVRRIRLGASVLIIEWAEEEPYHKLNDVEQVHRHFVTAFDVRSDPWRVVFRNEWKLHFLGFPLDSRDLWFSAHTDTHYAVYIWQANRSAWGENEPLESLLVWDISQASDYHPSQDPSGREKPPTGPQMVKSLSYKDLDHLNLRQRDNPSLHGLGIESGAIYFYEMCSPQEHGTRIGTQPLHRYVDWPWKKTISIPVVGLGPPWPRGWKVDSIENCKGLEHPCQNVRDEVAGVNYTVGMSKGKPWLCTEHEGWCSALDIEKYDWCPWVRVHAEERWLVMQCERNGIGTLKILRFDHYAGDKGFALK